jgi:hypothetical protein
MMEQAKISVTGYLNTHIIGFDLYAGCFSLSLQIKPEKYYEYNNKLNKSKDTRTFDERLLIHLFLKLISIKCNESNKEGDSLTIKTPEDLKYILFFLHNFSYIEYYLDIHEITYKSELIKLEDNEVENIFILILENCKRFINEKNIGQIRNYYNNLKLFLEENKLSYWLDNYKKRSIFFLLLIDILFQNNEQILKKRIIDSNILLTMINVYFRAGNEFTDSLHLLNEFLIDYEKLIIYLYITNPLEIISDELYSGGNYYEKYMKYKQKYIQLKAKNRNKIDNKSL